MENRFSQFKNMDQWTADMLNDAYQAVTVTQSWDSMKNFAGESFMFGKEPWISNVMTAMQHRDSHSGASFGWTMRQIEYIAKEGWDAYVELKNKH
jgi:hypothetical protein